MNKIFLSMLMAALLLTSSCQTSSEVKNYNRPRPSNTDSAGQPTGDFLVEFTSNPAQFKAGEPAELIFTIKNDKGETVKDFQIVHEKPIHLLIVSDDLAEFYH